MKSFDYRKRMKAILLVEIIASIAVTIYLLHGNCILHIFKSNFVCEIFDFMVLVNLSMALYKMENRSAEICAQFTLDCMPGLQMQIDAALNTEVITDDEARRKRAELSGIAGKLDSLDTTTKQLQKMVQFEMACGLFIFIYQWLITGINLENTFVGTDAIAFMAVALILDWALMIWCIGRALKLSNIKFTDS